MNCNQQYLDVMNIGIHLSERIFIQTVAQPYRNGIEAAVAPAEPQPTRIEDDGGGQPARAAAGGPRCRGSAAAASRPELQRRHRHRRRYCSLRQRSVGAGGGGRRGSDARTSLLRLATPRRRRALFP
jgi:hypothetical protein